MDIVFRCQFTLPPRTDILVANKPNNMPCKTLVRNLYTFYFKQCFTVSLTFSSIYLILLVLISSMAFSGPLNWKFARTSFPYSPPWLTRFPFANMSKAQLGRDRNINAIIAISVAHGQLPLLNSDNCYEPQ